ncbi:nucleotidyltransferase domain-containing protein, partial [Streptomyces anthocyanicus]|uniref:nucleotidyltransferase domain-containing protein n=1 Tax=Streptomyces anthocyanicus TaxID=68174 RepID=UPI0039E0CF4D
MSHYAMSAEDALALLERLHAHGVDACVGGGWSVDALLGKQTRDHSDLDLWVPAVHLDPLFVAFGEAGVDRIFPWPGDRPWNFVLHDGGWRPAVWCRGSSRLSARVLLPG